MNVPTNLSSTTHRSLAIQRGIDLNRAGLHIPHNMMDRICASHIDDSDIAAARNLLNKGGPTPEGLGAMISGAAVPIVVSTALVLGGAPVTLIALMIGLASAGLGAAIAVPAVVDLQTRNQLKKDPVARADAFALLKHLMGMKSALQREAAERSAGAALRGYASSSDA